MNPGSRSGAADGNAPAHGGGGNCGGSDGGMGMDTRILHFEKMVPYLCRGSQFFRKNRIHTRARLPFRRQKENSALTGHCFPGENER